MKADKEVKITKRFLVLVCVLMTLTFLPVEKVAAQTVDATNTEAAIETGGALPNGRPVPDTSTSEDASDLAKKLSNPVASLISVPFQFNYDTGFGTLDADRWTLNVQPVVPLDLTEDFNLISRTIIPFIDAEPTMLGVGGASGIGDIVQSFFLSPKEPTSSGWIWGAGPVILIPTGNSAFSADQWGLGPTAVALKQQNGWTYGALANHICGIDTPSNRPDVNSTFPQPFLSYTTPNALTYGLNTESTCDWTGDQWTLPVNVTVSKLITLGNQPLSVQLGYKHFAYAPIGGPDWGLRFNVTFLFPK